MFVDLRPWDVRVIEVLVDGEWCLADLEAYRRDATGWHGFVRHSDGPGLNRLGWYPQERLRATGPE